MSRQDITLKTAINTNILADSVRKSKPDTETREGEAAQEISLSGIEGEAKKTGLFKFQRTNASPATPIVSTEATQEQEAAQKAIAAQKQKEETDEAEIQTKEIGDQQVASSEEASKQRSSSKTETSEATDKLAKKEKGSDAQQFAFTNANFTFRKDDADTEVEKATEKAAETALNNLAEAWDKAKGRGLS